MGNCFGPGQQGDEHHFQFLDRSVLAHLLMQMHMLLQGSKEADLPQMIAEQAEAGVRTIILLAV